MASTLLYEDLAGRLGAQIRRGLLRPGERLPSLRRLGRQERVSIATAVEAYLRLEREGLVEARERSGYFVRAAALQPPQARLPRLQARAPQALRNPALLDVLDVLSREDLLPLHVTTPAAELLPVRAIAAAASHVLRRDPGLALAYGAPQGLPALRECIARRYLHCGVEVDPGSHRDSGGGEGVETPLVGVIGVIPDVGVDVEGAVGRREPGDTEVDQPVEQ